MKKTICDCSITELIIYCLMILVGSIAFWFFIIDLHKVETEIRIRYNIIE